MSEYQTQPIIKNPDGTYVVIHTSRAGTHPYQVCSREMDPGNAYDIAEIAAMWESLPEGHPRKQCAEECKNDPD